MRIPLKQPFRTFFGTLANQYRLEIIEALRKKDMNVTDICKATGFKQPTVTHNLKRLQHCGFVFMKQNGKERVFSLNKKTIKPVLKLMHSHMNKYCSKIYQEV
jgi:DNA-binding transcriptional ArsR family regulator